MHASKITCVIPVFNSAPTLRRAVDSCLGQPGGAEVVLVDDCSTDGSHALALEIAQGAPGRVRVLRNTANQGPAFSRNQGAFAGSGSLLCFLDADDVYLPGFFEKTAAILAAHENIAAVKTAVRVLNKAGTTSCSLAIPAWIMWRCRRPATW